MSDKSYVVYGAGGWAREVTELVKQTGGNVLYYLEAPREEGETINGIPVILKVDLPQKYSRIPKLIGYGDPRQKRRVVDYNDVYGKVVHHNSLIGDNVKIKAGCIISPFDALVFNVELGSHVHLGCHVFIGHDSSVENYCWLSHGTTIGSSVKIGEAVIIWSNSTIREKIKIGHGSVVGMGSVVTKDVPDNVLVFGNPAKFVRKLEPLRDLDSFEGAP